MTEQLPGRQGESPSSGDSHADARADLGGGVAPPSPQRRNAAPDLTRGYATDAITVEWYATRCIHSANCIRSLPAVFDPRQRPWITVEAATAEEIAAAVLRCPTGALHFLRTDGGPQETPDDPTTLTPIRNGPLYVRGDVEVRDLDGAPLRRDTRLSLCRCGHATRMPLCDNTCRSMNWQEPAPEDTTGRTGGPESAPPSSAEPAPQ